jgi:16S rRNA (guanine966-N2)-methyltransferase
MLGSLIGRAFLDLYAASGPVGLEAASRGASPVVLVERDRSALATLRANNAALEATDFTVESTDVGRYLAGTAPGRPFDVVFVDPPYDDDVDPVLAALGTGGWLAPGATVAVERASRGRPPVWPDGLEPDRSRRYGEATLWYGRRP